MKNAKPFILIGIMLASMLFVGWGATGHKIISQAGARDFPDRSIVTPAIIQRLTDSSSVPDDRHYGNNGYPIDPNEPNHFMDMEDIAELATHSITHNRDSLFLKYGETYIRNTVGFLPWVIDSDMTALTSQMRSGDWNKAWSTAGDIGHYVGDAHQPLHCSTYYNGYTSKYGSGSSGVHSRYETTMINKYQSSIVIDSTAVHFISNSLDEAFTIMYQSNSYMDSVYIADQYARTTTGSTSSSAYIDTFWVKSKSFTILQFQRAAVEYGSYLYTAWINAGSPVLPVVTSVDQPQATPAFLTLEQNYPNPFNPSTIIRYSLNTPSIVTLRVYDVLGRQIAVLSNGMFSAGRYTVSLNANTLGLSSGVYFYRLDAVNITTGMQNSLTKKLLYMK